MEQLARSLIFIEMLLVNLITTHNCSRKRHALIRVIGELTLYTILVFIVAFLVKIKLESIYLNGSIIVLLGITYFFPIKHVYKESADRITAIMFFSWIHTMTVTSFSMQITRLIRVQDNFNLALLIQTIVYLFSTPSIIKFIKNKFLYTLENIPKEMNKYLIVLSLVEFITLCMVTLQFMENIGPLLRIIVISLVGLTAAISYHLIYIIVKNFKSIDHLEQLAYSDTLTGIKNRLALFLDCEKLISEKKPFTLVFMDLDDFKTVNDTYGHSAGDDYINMFTKAAIKTIGDSDNIYRMSGDEFIYIYKGDKLEMFLSTFEEKIINHIKSGMMFLGVSIGWAKFPQDADSLDDLIRKADRIMYEAKNDNKQKVKSV